ncbi:hypothetical protein MUP32_06235 [Candidatus Microgenomates bacterium]|nr:hypothetical protein [Candidatus Microgenomates bacterium]
MDLIDMKVVIDFNKKLFLRIIFLIGIVGLFFLGIFLASQLTAREKSSSLPSLPIPSPQTKTKTATQNLKQYTFTAQNYVSQDPSRQKFTFSYSPKLEVVVRDANQPSRRIKLKPIGEEIEESYYISLDEPGQSLGEGIKVDKPGEQIWFSDNQYTKHNVYYEAENRLVMVIYDPKPALALGDIFVTWGKETRKNEALDQAKIILETLKEVK